MSFRIPKEGNTMKKKKDIGLEHINRLNIQTVRDPSALFTMFSMKYGYKKAKEICDDLYGAMERLGHHEFYAKKDADYNIAMTFSGCYDADIVRKACNWINDHQYAFGDEILEIGCDCGFMTTFLGSLFPNKHILAIDRNPSGIAIAKSNAEKFGLSNIDFMCIDVNDLTNKSFDTIFSMRTMQENSLSVKEDSFNELLPQADIFTKAVQTFANNISSLLKDNGHLVSIERLERNALFLAWIQSLTNASLKIDLDSFTELHCLELGSASIFESLVFCKENISDVDVFMSFMNCVANCIDTSLPQYDGWDAKIMYAFTGGKLIDGIELHDSNTGSKSRAVCRLHKYDNSSILWYINDNGNVHLEYHDVAQKDDCLSAIMSAKNNANQSKSIKFYEITE